MKIKKIIPFFFQGFINGLFHLFEKYEKNICNENGLILNDYVIETILRRDTEFLQSQLRGDEIRTIRYIPKFTEVSLKLIHF